MEEITSSVIQYFVADPLKLLYLLGGSGGIVYWLSLYRGRRRIRVRLISETIDLAGSPYLQITSTFEIENLGSGVTSLVPEVRFSGYNHYLEKKIKIFTLVNEQRKLEPFSPERFTITLKGETDYPFLYYRTYRFSLSRGLARRLRIRKEDKTTLGAIRFYLELGIFLIRGYWKRRWSKKVLKS